MSARPRSTRTPKRPPRLRLETIVVADAARFAYWPNVRQIEVGWKERGGRVTRTLCVKLHVAEKTDAIEPHERLPRKTRILVPTRKGRYAEREVPTDVVWHSPARLIAATDFVDPVKGGALIGVPGGQVGTYGGMVTDASGKRFHITAGHVIRPLPGSIVTKLPVLQPPVPGPTIPPNADVELGESAGGFVGNTPAGFIDFGLVSVTSSRPGTSEPRDGEPVFASVVSSAVVQSGPTAVTKFGARTGRTHGVFSGVVPAIVADGLFMTNVLSFVGTDPTTFADSGDSGSLVVVAKGPNKGMIVGILVGVMDPAPGQAGARGLVVPFDRLPVRPV